MDFGYEIPNISRFRANFFNQKYGIAAVFRQIPTKVLSFEDFEKFDAPLPGGAEEVLPCSTAAWWWSPARPAPANPPPWRPWWITPTRTAATTSSPSKTRSSSCTRARTASSTTAKSACIPSRSPSALRGALREDPDIILVGELRDLETIELALVAASTGHLVFGTLHTPSAAKTVDRIIDVFPAEQQNKIRATLSEALKGVVAQNLFKRIDKKGRVAALEILVFTTAIANLVREGKTHQIPGMIQVGKKIGNQPLDDAIMEHLRMKRISPEEAYDKAIDKKKFRTFLPHPPEDDENLIYAPPRT